MSASEVKKKENKSFTNGKQRIATKQDCNAPWAGNKRNFRCGFCGYRLKVGDLWRWVFTNDIKGAGGNPIFCDSCDDGKDQARAKWKEKCDMFYSTEWWWFNRDD